jgi:hypothetical protein
MSLTIITDSLAHLLSSGGAGLSNYVTIATTPVTYSATPASIVSVQATCAVDTKGNCVFLPQNVPYVVTSINGKPNIMPYNETSGFTGTIYKTLNDAMQSLIDVSKQVFKRPPPSTLPPSTTDLATTSAPSTTSPPPPSTESPPLQQPWEGDYITIEPNDTNWELLKTNEVFNPIIVDIVKSDQNKLLYKKFNTVCDLSSWESFDCDKLSNPKFKAFKNFKDAFEFISPLPETTAPGSTANYAPAPGGGKRTKKKGKRQTHKKHTRRHRRRAVN